MASKATYERLSASEHSAHLRKAVIAVTIGTTIDAITLASGPEGLTR